MRTNPNSWMWVGCALVLGACRSLPVSSPERDAPAADWPSWRGPAQVGAGAEIALPIQWDEPAWTRDLPGGGTPVIFGGRLYAMTYPSEGGKVVEKLVCLDAQSGATNWSHDFPDFLSDIIYERYAIGSPAVDPTTGRVHVMSSAGVAAAFDRNGKLLWQRSLMEELGRLTFPNGRTGSPLVLEDLVIHRGITSHWGNQAPGRDRFFAFDGATGELAWTSTPGTGPGDSSFSTPFVAWSDNRPNLYVGTGCGHVVAMDGRTGAPLWRFRTGRGGVNASVLVTGDRLVTIHGQENVDAARLGRMIALRLPGDIPTQAPGQVFELPKDAEIWRNPLSMFTSSPAVGRGHIYQCTLGGELASVSLATGEIEWMRRLGAGQLHASPLLAGETLFVPMWEGELNVLDVSAAEPTILKNISLEGSCLGAPAAWDGFLYVHTTERLYAWRGVSPAGPNPTIAATLVPDHGRALRSQQRAVPSEIALRPGETIRIRMQELNSNGQVRSERGLDPALDDVAGGPKSIAVVPGGIEASASASPWAGTVSIQSDGQSSPLRMRILPGSLWSEDFESYPAPGSPPDFWIGAKKKWTIETVDGNQVLAKSLDNILFQRNTTFIGHVDASEYDLVARVRSEGDRRSLSDVGLVNQRYLVTLRGNGQLLEVSSNQDRLKVSVPFEWTRDQWYHLRTRVEINDDGSGTIRARAWPDGTGEPSPWTIEVPVATAHPHGAPGIFGFSLQGRNRVFVDDIRLSDMEAAQ